MTWARAVVITVLVMEALFMLGRIGKPREPLTGAGAIGGLIEYAALIWLVVVIV